MIHRECDERDRGYWIAWWWLLAAGVTYGMWQESVAAGVFVVAAACAVANWIRS